MHKKPAIAIGPITQTHWYVVARNGRQVVMLTGPFACKDKADSWYKQSVSLAQNLDSNAVFYSFGVARLLWSTPGKLNSKLNVPYSDLAQVN